MHLSRAAGVLLAFTVVPSGLCPSTAAAQKAAWQVKTTVRADIVFDDNPFLLTPGRKADVNQPAAADITSGRFTDMESATDIVAAPGLELRLTGPGIGGRDLELAVAAAYEANVSNARRRHIETTVTVDQALGADRLRLRTGWRPAYFSKNYLADAIDGNADGEIAAAERRYDAGVSTEIDVRLSYRHRFSRVSEQRPVGVALEVGVRYLDRAFRAPFPGRSRSGPGATAGVAVAGARWALDLDYAFGALRGDATREVLILDETAFARDFNGNGNATNLDARAFELVDRSRTEHDIEVRVRGELARKVTGELSYGLRLRSFSSTQPFDVAGRGRDDTQHDLAAEVAVTAAKHLELVFSGRRVAQNTNRPADPGSTGEVVDYTRYVAGAAVRYRL